MKYIVVISTMKKNYNKEIKMPKNQIVNVLNTPEIWEQLTQESAKVAQKYTESSTLTKTDIKEVQSIKKQIDTYLKSYKSAIKEKTKLYEEMINAKLEESGYVALENLLNEIKAKNKTEQNKRISDKMDYVNELIRKYKNEYFGNKELKISTDCLSHILKLFPDLSSGAKNKEIKDWSIIENIIKNLYKESSEALDNVSKEQLEILPLSSDLYSNLTTYFRTGYFELLENISSITETDAKYIKTYKLEEVLKDPDALLEKISSILTDKQYDSKMKVFRIERLIELHRNGERH